MITGSLVCTCVDGLVAGKVAFVAESSLAAVALVWLIAVNLEHVLFQRFVFGEFGVAFVAEECTVFWEITVKINFKLQKVHNFCLLPLLNIQCKLTTAGVGVLRVQLCHLLC